MTDFDVQAAFDNLRHEIQKDRLATHDVINSGFDRLADKFEEHARDDAREFADIKQRVTDVERTQKIVGGSLAAFFTAMLGALIAWVKG